MGVAVGAILLLYARQDERYRILETFNAQLKDLEQKYSDRFSDEFSDEPLDETE